MNHKVGKKTNISKRQYRKIVSEIENDSLIKRSTLSVAAFAAVAAVLTGTLIWFAQISPGNLIRATGTVTSISSGLADAKGTINTYVIFDFRTKEGEEKTVRSITNDGLNYTVGQKISIGYHPSNPNYARNLHNDRPPVVSYYLWSIPLVLLVWFSGLAIVRFRMRQEDIWNAAEAADVPSEE